MPIRKKDDRLGAKKRFDPRTGEETNKPGGVDPRTIYRPKPDVKPTEMNSGGDIEVKQLDPLGKRLSDVGMMGGVGKMNKYVLRNQKKVIQKIPNKNFKSATTSGKDQKKLAIKEQKNIESKMTRKGDEYKVFITRSKGGLSPKQKAIASKAPPPNKITGADFAVLKKEKAKGRGMGLQDESVQPGKVMKAKRGMSFSDKMKAVEDGKINKKTGKPTSMAAMREMKGFKPGESASEFMKRRKELGAAGKALSATRIGKIVLPVAAAGVAAQQYLKSKMKKKDKKMGGGMMKKYSKGGGADSGTIGEMKSKIGVAMNKAKRLRSMDRLTERDLEKLGDIAGSIAPYIKKKMGGGMIAPSQRPGYSKGTMVKARGCKLGRTRPTKIT